MRVRPEKALTSMNRVDFGRWKLVMMRSMALNRYPGVMKRFVSPLNGRSVPLLRAADSNVLTAVDPTAVILPPPARTAFSATAASSDRGRQGSLPGCPRMWAAPAAAKVEGLQATSQRSRS